MFKLVSNYQPTGDQPKAIEYLSKGIEEGKKEGIQEGMIKGRQEAEKLLVRLVQYLQRDGRLQDIELLSDEDARKKLYKE